LSAYNRGESFVHRLSPLTKMLWCAAVLAVGVAFNHPLYLGAVLGTVICVALLGKQGRELARSLSGLGVLSLILFLIQILFYHEGRVVLALVPLGHGYGHVTTDGILFGLAMVFRMNSILLSVFVLLATTQPREIVLALVEKLRVPYDYAFMFTTALRFIPVLLAEARVILAAQETRGCAVSGHNPLRKLKAYIPLAVPLVMISLNKAERLAISLETRAFGSGNRTSYYECRLAAADMLCMVIVVGVLLTSLTFSFLGYGRVNL